MFRYSIQRGGFQQITDSKRTNLLVSSALTALAFFTRFYKINNPDEVVLVLSRHSHSRVDTDTRAASMKYTLVNLRPIIYVASTTSMYIRLLRK